MGNNTVITSHLVVPNPYTVLSLLPLQTSWFTCLDLEDTFFCLHLDPVSQPLFVFEWEDSHTRRKTQMTWTKLPLGFKNSPTLFRETLSPDFVNFSWKNPSCTLLQYRDDLLLASHNQWKCWKGTKGLPQRLGIHCFLVKGPGLLAKGRIPQVPHFRRMPHLRSGEETGHLLHATAKDRKGSPRFLGSSKIVQHLDTQIFKPGQTTLWGQRRLWKGPSKLGTRPRVGLPGDRDY
jgi:hypothetical protein